MVFSILKILSIIAVFQTALLAINLLQKKGITINRIILGLIFGGVQKYRMQTVQKEIRNKYKTEKELYEK